MLKITQVINEVGGLFKRNEIETRVLSPHPGVGGEGDGATREDNWVGGSPDPGNLSEWF